MGICVGRRQFRLVLFQGCPRFTTSKKIIRWANEVPELGEWAFSRLELRVEDESQNGLLNVRSYWDGRKAPSRLVILILTLRCCLSSSDQVALQGCGTDIPSDCNVVTVVTATNSAVLVFFANKWEELAGRPMSAPEFTPATCWTKRCPNTAYVLLLAMLRMETPGQSGQVRTGAACRVGVVRCQGFLSWILRL